MLLRWEWETTFAVPLAVDTELGGGIEASLSTTKRFDFRARLADCDTEGAEADGGEEMEWGEMDGELVAGVDELSSAGKVDLAVG